MNFRTLLRNLIIILFILLLANLSLLSGDNIHSDLNGLFIGIIFDAATILERKLIVFAVNSLIIVVIFGLMYGTYIYKKFTEIEPYIFTRIKNRKRWFYMEVLQILQISVLFAGTYVLCSLILCMIFTKEFANLETIYIAISQWFSFSLILFLITLLINYISICFKEKMGFLFSYSIFIFLIGIAVNSGKSGGIHNYYILLMNPVSSLMMFIINGVKYKAFGYTYYFVLSVVIVICMGRKVEKIDIGI